MEDAHTQQERLKTLILLAKSGDEKAFEEVYQTYYTPLFRYIKSRIHNTEEAEDMTQTVFMKIYISIENWNPDHTSPLAFFFTVARNMMIDYFRKSSRKEIVSDEIVQNIAESSDLASDSSRDRELGELLNQAIQKLSREQQEVIKLFYMNDLTYKEIASITGKREDAVRQVHSRAMKKLRKLYTYEQ